MLMLPYQVVYTVVSVKCILVNYSDTTSSSVFSHHTRTRLEGGSSEPNEPPRSATGASLWISNS